MAYERVFEIGDKFYIRKAVKDRLCHVRGFIDDCIVYRWWSKRRQEWIYEAEQNWLIEYSLEIGMYRQ